MVTNKKDEEPKKPRRPPATTPEAQEKKMIGLAVSLAEKQLEEGTASTPVITHYLRLASTTHELEREKIRKENLLLEARVQSMATDKNVEGLYQKAIDAMREYKGEDPHDFD